jgi:hypothetical protein
MTEKDYDKGFTCPSCGSFVKLYKRPINSSMAIVLILMYKANRKGFFHVEQFLKEIGRPELRADFHKLRFWNLIEPQPGIREDGSNRNGYYKITGRGVAFCQGQFTVQKTAVLLHYELQRLEGPEVTIKDCLKEKFNYNELMGAFEPKTNGEMTELKQLGLF